MFDFASPIIANILLSAAAAAAAPLADLPRERVQLAQLTIEQRVIIRIPIVPQQGQQPNRRGVALAPPAPPEVPAEDRVREVKGPKCLKLDQLRGALLNVSSGITMVTDKNERFRAHFSKACRSADFYAGFYIEPNKDGAICAGRDSLHARNGSACDIERFAKLVAEGD